MREEKSKFQNFQTILFLVLSIITTVFYVLFKPMPVLLLVILQILSIIGIIVLRYAYEIGYFSNYLHTIFNTKYASTDNYEPTELVINSYKFIGYLFIIAQFALAFTY